MPAISLRSAMRRSASSMSSAPIPCRRAGAMTLKSTISGMPAVANAG